MTEVVMEWFSARIDRERMATTESEREDTEQFDLQCPASLLEPRVTDPNLVSSPMRSPWSDSDKDSMHTEPYNLIHAVFYTHDKNYVKTMF